MRKILFLFAIVLVSMTSCEERYNDFYDQPYYENDYNLNNGKTSCTYCGCGYGYIDYSCRCCCHTHWPVFKHRGNTPQSGCCQLGWKGTVYDPYYKNNNTTDVKCSYCGCSDAYSDPGCKCCCHTHWPRVKQRGGAPGTGCCTLGWKGTIYDPNYKGNNSSNVNCSYCGCSSAYSDPNCKCCCHTHWPKVKQKGTAPKSGCCTLGWKGTIYDPNSKDNNNGTKVTCSYCGCSDSYKDPGCKCCCHTHWPKVKQKGTEPKSGCCSLGWKGTIYDPKSTATKSAMIFDNHDDHEHDEGCNH